MEIDVMLVRALSVMAYVLRILNHNQPQLRQKTAAPENRKKRHQINAMLPVVHQEWIISAPQEKPVTSPMVTVLAAPLADLLQIASVRSQVNLADLFTIEKTVETEALDGAINTSLLVVVLEMLQCASGTVPPTHAVMSAQMDQGIITHVLDRPLEVVNRQLETNQLPLSSDGL